MHILGEHRQLQKLERPGKEFGITIVFHLLETLLLFMQMKDQLHANLKVFTKNRSTVYLEVENGKMVALQISPKIESLYLLARQATKL